MKKLVAIIFIFFLIANISYAEQSEAIYKLYIDDKAIEFSEPIQVIDGRMYAPARQVAESLGARVAWKEDLRAMVLFKESDYWIFHTRENLTYRNGRRYPNDAGDAGDVRAVLIAGTSMLPVRFLGENLFDMDVKYDSKSKSTHITSVSSRERREQALMSTSIMGESIATASQMANYLLKKNANPKISVSALELAEIFLEEGAAEGVRGDFAFAQSIIETGAFRFTGAVDPEQNNFCGLGATGGVGVKGNVFESTRIGVRAQIQHLKCYATKDDLNNELVDPRWFNSSTLRGSAPELEFLAQARNPSGVGWAYPGYPSWKYNSYDDAFAEGQTYGQTIHTQFLAMVSEDY